MIFLTNHHGHIPEGFSLYQRRRENLKPGVIWSGKKKNSNNFTSKTKKTT
jgi:hypothetical protein